MRVILDTHDPTYPKVTNRGFFDDVDVVIVEHMGGTIKVYPIDDKLVIDGVDGSCVIVVEELY